MSKEEFLNTLSKILELVMDAEDYPEEGSELADTLADIYSRVDQLYESTKQSHDLDDKGESDARTSRGNPDLQQ